MMAMDILLASLMGFGFALNDELSKQTQILAAMQAQQAEQSITQGQAVLKRTSHQQGLVEKASKALESKDYELALSFSERLLKLEQLDPLYYVLRADCLARLGRISDAIENYDKSLDMNDRTHSLSPYLESNLKITIAQLEEIQSKIIRSDQKPTTEEISKMLDDVKSKQTHTTSTVEFLVSEDISRDIKLAINQFMQNQKKDPIALLSQLNGKSASKRLDRLVLYEICLDTVSKATNAFVVFEVNDCRLHNLFTQFTHYESKGKLLLHGEIGWLPEMLYHIAEQRGFHLFEDPYFRNSTIEGGSIFQQDFLEANPRLLAQTIEEMHILATADEQYIVTARINS
jgi:hypothetical protein